MDDLIRRSDAAKDLREYAERKAQVNGIEYANGILAAACRIEQVVHAVDAEEVVHGYWVNGNESRYQNVSNTLTCSVCGEPATKAFGVSVKSRYCPWCGARMDGRREEDGT